jgi:hypothetical protein
VNSASVTSNNHNAGCSILDSSAYIQPQNKKKELYLSLMTAPRGVGADGRGDDDPAMMRSMPSTRRTTATTSAAKRATASAIQTRLQIA